MESAFTFLSADGKTQIHAVSRAPQGEPKAVVQLTHGMVEFIARYAAFADALAARGFLVVGHDHLGHGASVISQDRWGYFDPDHPSGVLIEDMHRLRLLTQRETGSLPYFMLGHSMGSYLLREYLSLHSEGLAGAVIMGTGFQPPAVAGFGLTLCRAIALFRGWEYRSRLVSSLTLGGKDYRGYCMDGSDPDNSWLTKDADIVRAYYQDPRCTFTFTLNGFRGLLEAVRFSCTPAKAAMIRKDLPLLLVSGEDDPVGSRGEGVRKVQRLLGEAGLSRVEMKLFPGDRHEILNETDRKDVMAFLAGWFEKQL